MTDAPQGPTTGLTPHIAINDGRAAEAIDFYAAAFGAVEQRRASSRAMTEAGHKTRDYISP
jgi:uncharacterized glyoxalase superfamily protein PhnB